MIDRPGGFRHRSLLWMIPPSAKPPNGPQAAVRYATGGLGWLAGEPKDSSSTTMASQRVIDKAFVEHPLAGTG